MKDKELRELLSEKGIIRLYLDGKKLSPVYAGFTRKDHDRLNSKVDRIDGQCFKLRADLESQQFTIANLTASIVHLEEKFNAINKHYGITVEYEDAKYVVKDVK